MVRPTSVCAPAPVTNYANHFTRCSKRFANCGSHRTVSRRALLSGERTEHRVRCRIRDRLDDPGCRRPAHVPGVGPDGGSRRHGRRTRDHGGTAHGGGRTWRLHSRRCRFRDDADGSDVLGTRTDSGPSPGTHHGVLAAQLRRRPPGDRTVHRSARGRDVAEGCHRRRRGVLAVAAVACPPRRLRPAASSSDSGTSSASR
ncbi:MAG: hypothetical protein K0R01_363 [Mycobacterium sp.]|nr:hypothetical protein [Mycobacterium sp.]